MSSDLKPCPFCSGEASANGRVSYSGLHQAWWPDGTQVLKAFYVNCMSCGCSNQGMFGHQTQGDAITAWNTRAAPKVRLPDAAKALLGCDELGGRKVVYDACELRVKVHKFDAVLREILSALETGEAS